MVRIVFLLMILVDLKEVTIRSVARKLGWTAHSLAKLWARLDFVVDRCHRTCTCRKGGMYLDFKIILCKMISTYSRQVFPQG